jgi:hypothetical protein
VLVIHSEGGLQTGVRVPSRQRGYHYGHADKALIETEQWSPMSVTNGEFLSRSGTKSQS